ncbi:hypothetical protein GLAREA_05983 [Glarea lozoyensis ATCC 20868]|uniref:Uncharacterized protein n=1 Tax=Glarea lozoyensis (strain ATCC 20868 / MF5171) TaxID=1116229 RepID=S3DLN9_GLAL2|nr:uncharacterized protein GLAREA_05983 [Glarea lozoyensis ATCC 20868]EPE32971.1 hypothetical protein GLAREA_05983 [Glarea lozoyensis ATCC 20868]
MPNAAVGLVVLPGWERARDPAVDGGTVLTQIEWFSVLVRQFENGIWERGPGKRLTRRW